MFKKVLAFIFIVTSVVIFGVENKPFPQEVKFNGCIKPTNYTQTQMNNDVSDYFDKWKSKYVKASSGVTPGGGYYVNMTGIGGNGNEITTSEAHGYGMIVYVLMAGYDSKAKNYFDGMYNMYNKHRSKVNKELMSWVIDKSELTSKDSDSAADGDMDIAYALLLADKQWGSNGAINYLSEAKRIISKGIKVGDTHQASKRTSLGDWDTDNIYNTRSSDWMTGHFYAYAKATGDSYWIDLRNNTYSIITQISKNYAPNTGFMPDFVVGTTPKPAAPNFLEAGTDGDYSWNACRFPWRMALDYAHTGSPQAKEAINKISKFIISNTGGEPSRIKAGYKLNGNAMERYSAMAFTAPFVAGTIGSATNQDYLNKGWGLMRKNYEGYYEDTINLLCMLFISGNWWAPESSSGGESATNTVSTNIYDSRVFNAQFYYNKYSDLQKAIGNNETALKNHWKEYGVKEGRQAHANFSVKDYLNRYEDLKKTFGTDNFAAIKHYIDFGLKEGRNGAPADIVVPPVSTVITGKWLTLVAKHSGKALHVKDWSKDNAAPVLQWSNNGTENSQWMIEPVGNGYYRLKNRFSSLYFETGAHSMDNGGIIQQYAMVTTHEFQQWQITPVKDGYFKFINKSSGKALDVSGVSLDNGAVIHQWNYNGTDNQLFKLDVVTTTTTGGNTGGTSGGGTTTVTNKFYNGATAGTSLIGLANGKIAYGKYANRNETNESNQLPDFSYAGYKKGGVKLPNAAVKITLYPQSGDNSARIQDAINYVSNFPADANGVKGAILLKKGKFSLGKTLYLNKSGVVLRGEGQGSDGTILFDSQTVQNNCVVVGGNYTINELSGSKTRITSSFVGSGTKSFNIESPVGYKVGDSVIVQRTPNSTWLDFIDMTKYGWATSRYTVDHLRKITAIDGAKITVDIPLVDTMETKYGSGYLIKIEKNVSVQNTGIENIRFDSYYRNSTDEEHGWTAIQYEGVENSWVKNVTAIHFGYSCVNMANDSNFNTIQDCAVLEPISSVEGGRRYSFAIQKGMGNLIQRCYTNGGRHDFVTGSTVAGPNVFLDCYAENCKSNTGPHHRWATGILFDNVFTQDISVENRKDSGSGHGWAGAQIVFWNCETKTIVCDAPKGAMNFAIGCTGAKSEGQWAPEEPAGYFESHGKHVALRSLYLQQLYERLGMVALDNILIPEQKTGDIYDKLKAWAGK